MLKGARSMREPGARDLPQSWADPELLTVAKNHIEAVRHGWRSRMRLRAPALATLCLMLGALLGSIVGATATGRIAHQKGACAALNMAAARGYLDERQQRIVMHTLATAVNPDVDLFPGGYRALRDVCGGGRS